MLGLRIDVDQLRRESERVFARKDVELPVDIDLRTPAGEAWFRMARTTFDNARDCGGLLYQDPSVAASVASMLVTGLLLAAGAVYRALPEELRTQVTAITATTPNDVTLVLGDVDVRWGGAADSAEKAVVLAAAMVANPPAGVSVYDVSSPGAVVIR